MDVLYGLLEVRQVEKTAARELQSCITMILTMGTSTTLLHVIARLWKNERLDTSAIVHNKTIVKVGELRLWRNTQTRLVKIGQFRTMKMHQNFELSVLLLTMTTTQLQIMSPLWWSKPPMNVFTSCRILFHIAIADFVVLMTFKLLWSGLTTSQPSPKSYWDNFLNRSLWTFHLRHEGEEEGLKTSCVGHSEVKKWHWSFRNTGLVQHSSDWTKRTRDTSAGRWIATDSIRKCWRDKVQFWMCPTCLRWHITSRDNDNGT